MSEHSRPTGSSSEEDAHVLAVRLRDAREYLNLSQQFVAEQTGLPRSAISDIERGARRVDSLELKRFAALYRLPTSHFLGDNEPALEGSDPMLATLARTTREMAEPEKQQLLRFAQFLRNFDDGKRNDA